MPSMTLSDDAVREIRRVCNDDDSCRTVIAILPHETVIRDFADCSLHVSITGGLRRCVWHCYGEGAVEMLLDWFLMELGDLPYSID